jgi:hypothetical protein
VERRSVTRQTIDGSIRRTSSCAARLWPKRDHALRTWTRCRSSAASVGRRTRRQVAETTT